MKLICAFVRLLQWYHFVLEMTRFAMALHNIAMKTVDNYNLHVTNKSPMTHQCSLDFHTGNS